MALAPCESMPAEHLTPPLQWRATTRRLQVTYVLGLAGGPCERDGLRRRSAAVISLAATLLLTLAGCERWALDRKMEELCRKDGGVKVYETVTLPPKEFEAIWTYVQRPQSLTLTTTGRTTDSCRRPKSLSARTPRQRRVTGNWVGCIGPSIAALTTVCWGSESSIAAAAVTSSRSDFSLATMHVREPIAILHIKSS